MRRLIVTIVLIAAALLLGSTVMRRLAARKEKPKREKVEAPAVAVRVAKAARTTFQEKLRGYGRARALRTTRVAAEVAGVVRWVAPHLEAGAEVNVGEDLVRIDDRDLTQALKLVHARQQKNVADGKRVVAELNSATRKLEVARDELATAERELKRISDLREGGAGTESELDQQRMATALRRTAVVEFEGRIASLAADGERITAEHTELVAAEKQADVDLGRATIKAPYTARVVARAVEFESRVAPGTVLFELIDLSRVEIPIALPAARYGQVRANAVAKLRLGATEVTANVTRIAPRVTAADRTFYAYVVLAPKKGPAPIPPGAFVTAVIHGRLFESVFVLPRTAFVGERIFVAADGVARERMPHVREALPHLLIVDGGVAEGEKIIVTNLDEVAAGTRVAATP